MHLKIAFSFLSFFKGHRSLKTSLQLITHLEEIQLSFNKVYYTTLDNNGMNEYIPPFICMITRFANRKHAFMYLIYKYSLIHIGYAFWKGAFLIWIWTKLFIYMIIFLYNTLILLFICGSKYISSIPYFSIVKCLLVSKCRTFTSSTIEHKKHPRSRRLKRFFFTVNPDFLFLMKSFLA